MSQTKVAVGMVDATGTPGSGNFLRGDGSWTTVTAAPWVIIGTAVASGSASLTVTGLPTDGTYDTFAIGISDLIPATDAVQCYFRLGDSSGVDSGSADYNMHIGGGNGNASNDQYGSSSSYTVNSGTSATDHIGLTSHQAASCGSDTGEGLGAMLYLTSPGDTTIYPRVSGTVNYVGNGGLIFQGHAGGHRKANIATDRVNVSFSSGNVETGRMTVWGIAHA